MPISAFDQEDDPFDNYYDDDVADFSNGPASSTTALPTTNALSTRTEAAMNVFNDKIEQHALHTIFLDTALQEVPWTL